MRYNNFRYGCFSLCTYRIQSVSFLIASVYKYSKIAIGKANERQRQQQRQTRLKSTSCSYYRSFRYGSCWYSFRSLVRWLSFRPYILRKMYRGTRKCGVCTLSLSCSRGRLCTHNFHPEKQSILQSKQVLRAPWKIFYNVYYVCQGCVHTFPFSPYVFGCVFRFLWVFGSCRISGKAVRVSARKRCTYSQPNLIAILNA